MNLPLVIVIWNDAHVEADLPITLETVGETHKPMVIRTMGWVLRDDEIGISLANEHYEGTYRGRTFIHRPMVISTTPYALTRPRQKRKPKLPQETPTA